MTHVALNEILDNCPIGLRLAYAVEVSGIPEFWTTGEDTWTHLLRTERPGALVTTDWKYTLRGDALKPLDTGSGFSFNILDDGSGYLRKLASRNAGKRIPIRENIQFSQDTVEVLRTTDVEVGQYLYIGLETVKVSAIDGNVLTIDRGQLGTVPREHLLMGGSVGPELSTTPVVWNGRWVKVYTVPVEIDGSIDDTADIEELVLTAGIINGRRFEDTSLEISCLPIASAIKREWPAPTPAGTIPFAANTVSLSPENYVISFNAMYITDIGGVARQPQMNSFPPGFSVIDAKPIGTYSDVGIFELLDTTITSRTVEAWSRAIGDTIEFWSEEADWRVPVSRYDLRIETQPGEIEGNLRVTAKLVNWGEIRYYTPVFPEPGPGGQTAQRGTEILLEDYEGELAIKDSLAALEFYRADRDAMSVYGRSQTDNGAWVAKSFRQVMIGETMDWGVMVGGASRGVMATSQHIPVMMDNPYRPVNSEWSSDNVAALANRGFVQITGDEGLEVIEVTSVEEAEGYVTLFANKRGQANTLPRNWGGGEARVSQIFMVSGDGTETGLLPAEDVILNILLGSTGRLLNGTYDTHAYGANIPEEFVDVEGIRAVVRKADLPDLASWWANPGEGGDALEQWMSFFGLYFVERRIGTDFKLTVRSIAPPTDTRYNEKIGDEHRKENSKASPEPNEQMAVNVMTFKLSANAGEQYNDIKVYHDTSISSFGAQEPMELEVPGLYSLTSGVRRREVGGDYETPTQSTNAVRLSIESAARWFAALAFGEYALTIHTPHIGWRYQAGDHIKVELTGVYDDKGNANTSKVFEAIEVRYTHGNKAGAEIRLRASYSPGTEMAPGIEILSQGPTVETTANRFSDPGQETQLESAEDTTQDAEWFDPKTHGAAVPITVWRAGHYGQSGSITTVNIISRSGTELVLDAALPWDPDGDTVPTYATYADWEGANDRQKEYAYIADNTLILGTDDEAKRYV